MTENGNEMTKLGESESFKLRLHGIGYIQIHLGSDPLWYGSTLFTWDWFKTGTVRLHIGSPS